MSPSWVNGHWSGWLPGVGTTVFLGLDSVPMTGAADPLARFYAPSGRASPDLSGRRGIYGHVDALLNHLQIPAEIDPDGDWLLPTEVGQFTLFVRDTDQRLIVRQKVMTIDSSLADYATDVQLLMLLNLECEGVAFASQAGPDDTIMVVLTGQVPWEGLDAGRLSRLLEAAFGMSRELDEALNDEPGSEVASDRAAAAAAAKPEVEAEAEVSPPPADPALNGHSDRPANWYEDPRGEARLRYWDGSVWTDHTAV
jgi:hypothetical protein